MNRNKVTEVTIRKGGRERSTLEKAALRWRGRTGRVCRSVFGGSEAVKRRDKGLDAPPPARRPEKGLHGPYRASGGNRKQYTRSSPLLERSARLTVRRPSPSLTDMGATS